MEVVLDEHEGAGAASLLGMLRTVGGKVIERAVLPWVHHLESGVGAVDARVAIRVVERGDGKLFHAVSLAVALADRFKAESAAAGKAAGGAGPWGRLFGAVVFARGCFFVASADGLHSGSNHSHPLAHVPSLNLERLQISADQSQLGFELRHRIAGIELDRGAFSFSDEELLGLLSEVLRVFFQSHLTRGG